VPDARAAELHDRYLELRKIRAAKIEQIRKMIFGQANFETGDR
jgi:hypothetical protein